MSHKVRMLRLGPTLSLSIVYKTVIFRPCHRRCYFTGSLGLYLGKRDVRRKEN